MHSTSRFSLSLSFSVSYTSSLSIFPCLNLRALLAPVLSAISYPARPPRAHSFLIFLGACSFKIKETTALVQHVTLLYPAPSLSSSPRTYHFSPSRLLSASNYASYLSLPPLPSCFLRRFPIFTLSFSLTSLSFTVRFALFFPPFTSHYKIPVFFFSQCSYFYLLRVSPCTTLTFLSSPSLVSRILLPCAFYVVLLRSVSSYTIFPFLLPPFPFLSLPTSFLSPLGALSRAFLLSYPAVASSHIRAFYILLARPFSTLLLYSIFQPPCPSPFRSLPLFVRRHNFILGIRVYTGKAFVRELKCPAITRLAGSITCRATQFLRGSLLSLSYRTRDTVNEPGLVSILCQILSRASSPPRRSIERGDAQKAKARPAESHWRTRSLQMLHRSRKNVTAVFRGYAE